VDVPVALAQGLKDVVLHNLRDGVGDIGYSELSLIPLLSGFG
jgi:hypothetical protein